MMQFRDDIRIRQRRRSSRIHWSRIWFIVIGILILVSCCTLSYFYISLTPIRKDEDRIQKLVQNQTDIKTVEQVNIDYRTSTTYSAVGKTASGIEKVAIIKGKSSKVATYDRSDGLSNEQLRTIVLKKYNPSKIYSANISEYKGALVWEVSYKDQKGTLSFATLDFKTGNPYRTINGL